MSKYPHEAPPSVVPPVMIPHPHPHPPGTDRSPIRSLPWSSRCAGRRPAGRPGRSALIKTLAAQGIEDATAPPARKAGRIEDGTVCAMPECRSRSRLRGVRGGPRLPVQAAAAAQRPAHRRQDLRETKHIGARFFFPSRASANCRASTRAPPASAARSIAAVGPTWPAKSPRVARSWPATGHPTFRRDENVPPPSRALRWRHLRRALTSRGTRD